MGFIEKPAEDLALDLAGLLISETYPRHKKAKDREKWFQYWFRKLRRAIKGYAKPAKPMERGKNGPINIPQR